MRRLLLCLGLCLMAFFVDAQQLSERTIQEGVASFYGKRFHGRMTSNGEIFSMDSLTAAHKFLPFDTWVKVTRLDNLDSVWVRINDRLPKTSRRIIDLSRRAATELEMIEDGIARVRLEVSTVEKMNELYDYFEGDAPGTLRLRYFDQPILFKRRQLDFRLFLKGFSD